MKIISNFLHNIFLLAIVVALPAFAVGAFSYIQPRLEVPQSMVAGVSTEFKHLYYENLLENGQFIQDDALRIIQYKLEKKSIGKDKTRVTLGKITNTSVSYLHAKVDVQGYVQPGSLSVGLAYNNTIYWLYKSNIGSISNQVIINQPANLELVFETSQRINYPLDFELEIQY